MFHLSSNSATNRAAAGMFRLVFGSSSSKLIILVSTIVLSRLYTPEDFGVQSVFVSIVMLIVPLFTFQLDQAVPLPRSNAIAINLVFTVISFVIINTIILSLVVYLISNDLFVLISMKDLISYKFLLLIAIFLFSLFSILKMWAIRQCAYNNLAKVEVIQSSIGNLVKIILGFFGFGTFGLLVGQVLMQSSGLIFLLKSIYVDSKDNYKHLSLKKMLFVANYYKKIIIYRTPSQLMLILSAQFPILVITYMYGAYSAGQFGLALMSLSMPMNLIARNMSSAYFGEVSKLGRRAGSEIRESVLSLTKFLGFIGVILAIIIYMFSPTIYPFIFGANWSDAGKYASILSIYLAAQFVAAPISSVLTVFKKEEIYLQVDLQRFIMVIVLSFVSYKYNYNIISFLYLYSICLLLHYIYMFFRILNCIPVK